MIRSHLAFVLVLASAVGACAQMPPKDSPKLTAQAARYGVSRTLLYRAENRGFWPQISDGKTLFCRASAVTGSEIAAQECYGPAQLQVRLTGEEDEQRQAQQALQRNAASATPP